MRLAAAGWGTLSAVSLLIGAGIGVFHLPSRTVRAGMMAFGSGALVEALERRTREVLEDPGGLYEAFFLRCALAGAPVTVQGAEREVRGRSGDPPRRAR